MISGRGGSSVATDVLSGHDSGLMLLSNVGCTARLRWAPDACAPVNRPLLTGEVRVSIRSLVVDERALELIKAESGPFRRMRARGHDWLVVPARGCGVVIESLDRGVPLGQVVEATMHIGTHWVGQGRDLRIPGERVEPRMAGPGQLPMLALSGCGLGVIEEAVAAWRD